MNEVNEIHIVSMAGPDVLDSVATCPECGHPDSDHGVLPDDFDVWVQKCWCNCCYPNDGQREEPAAQRERREKVRALVVAERKIADRWWRCQFKNKIRIYRIRKEFYAELEKSMENRDPK